MDEHEQRRHDQQRYAALVILAKATVAYDALPDEARTEDLSEWLCKLEDQHAEAYNAAYYLRSECAIS